MWQGEDALGRGVIPSSTVLTQIHNGCFRRESAQSTGALLSLAVG